jgi:hypothetical protein
MFQRSNVPAQQFTYSLAPGAPRGARIDRTNGVFNWAPSAAYARTTNAITIRVTDNGVPSLTDSKTFLVVVDDYFELRLGTGIIPAGQTGLVPVITYTTTPVTNAVFEFEYAGSRLTSPSLQPPSPPLASAVLQSLGGNRYRVQLGTLAGQTLAGEQTVAQLRFVTAPNQPSAFVPLVVSAVTGRQANGQIVPRADGLDGRVVYLNTEPLLEMANDETGRYLLLYARAGLGHTIESTQNLNPVIQWLPFWQGVPAGLLEVITLNPTNQTQFFRARQP